MGETFFENRFFYHCFFIAAIINRIRIRVVLFFSERKSKQPLLENRRDKLLLSPESHLSCPDRECPVKSRLLHGPKKHANISLYLREEDVFFHSLLGNKPHTQNYMIDNQTNTEIQLISGRMSH